MDEYVNIFQQKVILSLYDEENFQILNKEIEIQEFKEFIHRKDIVNLLKRSLKIEVQDSLTRKNIILFQQYGRIDLKVELLHSYQTQLLNDNPRITVINKSNRSVTLVLDEYVSKRLLGEILNNSR